MRGPWVVEGERGDPRLKAATEVDKGDRDEEETFSFERLEEREGTRKGKKRKDDEPFLTSMAVKSS